jgi:methylated-DNA-[protein]-cysteine S-methyltransferase
MDIAWIDSLDTSPLGPVWIAMSKRGLVAIGIGASEERFSQSFKQLGYNHVIQNAAHLAIPIRQIGEYLTGQRTEFNLPIDWSVMTPFQEQALRITYSIPYGKTTTYGDIARQLNRPGAARAVGRAQATNPIPLVIPCHRVVGADGGLHGYGAPGGLETKAWLLRLEGIDEWKGVEW